MFAGLTLAALPWGVAAAAPPDALTPEPPEIVGGEPSLVCAWPSVVALQTGGLCTGTLVHPRVVVYAAHCGTFHSAVLFGEDVGAPAREVATLRCERHSELFAVSSMDFAYCELAEPVGDIAITPPLFGCDEALIEVGTPVTIVGFGDTTSDGPEQVGIKHEATTSIVGYVSTVGIGGMGTGADAGDSGGPAFVQLDDGSWRLLGVVSGGGGDGASVQYVPAPVVIEWIEDRSGIDITPCHAGDGSWAPTPGCEGFYIATEPGAEWADGCPSARSGPSDRCGTPWTELADTQPPSVGFIEPASGDSFAGTGLVFTVLAEASDAGVGVAQVRLSVDGAAWVDALGQAAVDEVPPYRFDSILIAETGEHLLELEAIDYFGNSSTASAVITLTEPSGDGDGDPGDGDSGAGATTTDTGAAPPDDEGGDCQCASEGDGVPVHALGSLVLLAVVTRRRRGSSQLGRGASPELKTARCPR
ncbi:trypsin-like serine protease [Enhygromyxa salina]|uniref:Trypsin n=1 Tax=Enhygromyxa salina TaxID=215803 RepID=A0A2S9XMB5_9BACT|nr:trypsin-like serine protease [Enhygromyxa salina]PRP93870.1 Trypsin [Enhygromyxa salina]